MKKTDDVVNFFGLDLASSSFDTLLATWRDHLTHSRKTAYIFTPNPEQIILARREARFKTALQQADWLLPDGVGLVWASQHLNSQSVQPGLQKRIPGRSAALTLIQLARTLDLPVLIVGGRKYHHLLVQDMPIETVTPEQSVATGFHLWWTPGYQQANLPTATEEQAVAILIKKLKPAVVLVALGAPTQEYWSLDHRADLTSAGVQLVMVVGGAFDVLTGQVAQPPEWVSRWGVEWLFRLMIQPWRWRRQLALLHFIWLVITRKLETTSD